MFFDYKVKKYKWSCPKGVAYNVANHYQQFAFLYSNDTFGDNNKKSFIAFGIDEEISSQELASLEKIDDNQWFGYLSYELKNCIETLPKDTNNYIKVPNLYMTKYSNILVFDHKKCQINYYYKEGILDGFLDVKQHDYSNNIKISSLKSNMTKEYYLEAVAAIKEKIIKGDVYQANITRKFFGEFENKIDGLTLFLNLSKISPSNYSCYFKYPGFEVVSSSPERFIQVDESNNISTKPIKGTAKSSLHVTENEQIKKDLFNSIKDRSENLMIVDLMRNDFAKICEAGSVEVQDLFKIESYKTLHHMVSKIVGKLKSCKNNIDLLKGCFPPGSMTGAPKIKAMIECSMLEKWQRGVYSGCIGRLSKNKSVDLSVVIRTLLVSGNKFEFQVGGAIVIDSDPMLELEETITKVRAIALALGINIDNIRNI